MPSSFYDQRLLIFHDLKTKQFEFADGAPVVNLQELVTPDDLELYRAMPRTRYFFEHRSDSTIEVCIIAFPPMLAAMQRGYAA